jgi:hypothetical protein
MKNIIRILTIIVLLLVFTKTVNSQITTVNLNISQPDVENCITGIETNLSQESITIFPNPTHGLFTISMTNHELMGKLKIVVYNINGQKIYSEKIVLHESSFEKQVNLSGYPAGAYLLNISANDKYYNAEIIIK